MKKRWAIAPAADEATVQALHAELGADYGALARVVAQRGSPIYQKSYILFQEKN